MDVHCGTGTHLGEAVYEVGGFVVHFFSETKVRRLTRGFDLIALEHAEEGRLPRDLYLVTLRQDPDRPPPLPPTETAAVPVSEGEIQSRVLCDRVEGGADGEQKKNATRPPGST